MTEPAPPPDDQLVSDHLDGLAEDPGAVPGSEAGRARLERFTAARDQVAADVPVPAAAREAALAAALRVFDTEMPAPGAAVLPGAHDPLDATGPAADELAARRRRRWRSAPLIGAAASVLLVVGLIAGVRREQGVDQTTSAGAPAPSGSERAAPSQLQAPAAAPPVAAGGGAAPGGSNDRADAPVAAAAIPPDLGDVTDAASFRRAMAAVLPRVLPGAPSTAPASPDASVPPSAPPASGCEAALRAAHPELGAVAVRTAARRGGATLPVLGFLVAAPPPAPPLTTAVRAFLVDPESCRAVLDETL
jgi:hypothetical protein